MLTANFLKEPICEHALPPISGDGNAAEQSWQQLLTNIGSFDKNASKDDKCEEELRNLINGIFAYSPYLTQTLLKETDIFLGLCKQGIAAAVEKIYDDCRAILHDSEKLADSEYLMKELRRLKRRLALVLGLCDISGRMALPHLTEHLTKFADFTVEIALQHVWRGFIERGYLPEDHSQVQGIFILGMGKYGGYELNYSSDIDLILLFDEERLPFLEKDPHDIQQILNRGVKQFVTLLDHVNRDGFVFRVDLDLRPDPRSTPPILAVSSAMNYYAAVGQTWERAALIKARIVAGDQAAGDLFLQEISPFIWRKSLDYYALNEIADIRRRMLQSKSSGGGVHGVGGFNVKLSYGGIREVEFLIQSQQLIWGGRNPFLRVANGAEAMHRLIKETILPEHVAEPLMATYTFLRNVEHRLQMVSDEQTQVLPTDEEALRRFAAFCGIPDVKEFADRLLHHVQTARELSDAFGPKTLEQTGDASAANLASVFTIGEFNEDAEEILQGLGFTETDSAYQIISRWLRGDYRAVRSEKSLQHLTHLLPILLNHISDSGNPDVTLVQFDRFLQDIPFGVQVFALLKAHPQLCNQLFAILGGAPTIGTWLSANPHLLDALLEVQVAGEGDAALSQIDRSYISLQEIIGDCKDLQDVLQVIGKWLNDQKFLCRVDFFNGNSGVEELMHLETRLAELTLSHLLPQVIKEFNTGNAGRADGDTTPPKVEDLLGLLAFGKFGSGELLPLSDLDIVFIFDGSADEEIAYGLSAMVYFVRLCQRILTALSAESGEGKLYSVDMRLRPSGNKSAVATPLHRFTDYYRSGEAWVWERMTLLRGRSVWGSDAISEKLQSAVTDIFTYDISREKIIADLQDMWRVTRQTHKGDEEWDIKYRPGGLQDLEYVIYGLQLVNIKTHPNLFGKHGGEALQALSAAGIISDKMAAELSQSYLVWMTMSAALKLIKEGEGMVAGDDLTPAQVQSLSRMLERSCGVSVVSDVSAIRGLMDEAAAAVKKQFDLLFG